MYAQGSSDHDYQHSPSNQDKHCSRAQAPLIALISAPRHNEHFLTTSTIYASAFVTLTPHAPHSHTQPLLCHSLKGAKTQTELCPPKPNELEMAAVTSCCFFTFGTVSMLATSSTSSS